MARTEAAEFCDAVFGLDYEPDLTMRLFYDVSGETLRLQPRDADEYRLLGAFERAWKIYCATLRQAHLLGGYDGWEYATKVVGPHIAYRLAYMSLPEHLRSPLRPPPFSAMPDPVYLDQWHYYALPPAHRTWLQATRTKQHAPYLLACPTPFLRATERANDAT